MTLTLSVGINVGDYIALVFPPDALNDEHQLFAPKCSSCDHMDIFYRNEVVRIYPNDAHDAGETVSYILSDFPSPQYSFPVRPFPIAV